MSESQIASGLIWRDEAKSRAWISGRKRGSEKIQSGRIHGDDALSSTAALIFRKSVAKSADNFALKRRSGGSTVKIRSAPPFSLKGFGHRRESIEIRACARDLRSSADPENVSFGRISANLPISL